MMHVGDIMSTVEGVQYHGGYHPLKFEYCGGCSVLWGTQITKDFPSMVLMNPPCAHDLPHGTQDNPPQYS